MNKPAMTRMRKQAQAGFTLIELIVVIVILGILAATALPRFSNLGGDARVASLNAVRGALSSTSATAHGQWLINQSLLSVPFEGSLVTFTVAPNTSGYPQADAGFAASAGITNTDYTVIYGPASSQTEPVTALGSFSVVPNSIAGTARATTCFVNYAQPAVLNGQPVITITATPGGC